MSGNGSTWTEAARHAAQFEAAWRARGITVETVIYPLRDRGGDIIGWTFREARMPGTRPILNRFMDVNILRIEGGAR